MAAIVTQFTIDAEVITITEDYITHSVVGSTLRATRFITSTFVKKPTITIAREHRFFSNQE